MKRKTGKSLLAVLLTALLLLGLAACGGSASQSADSAADVGSYFAAGKTTNAAPAAAAEPGEPYWDSIESAAGAGEDDGGSRSSLPDGVKMIYRASLELETTEYEQAAAQIRTLTQQFDGYFEEQSAYVRSGSYRCADYTVRVPAERFEEFLTQIGSVCTVVHQSQSAEDVSEYYYDMESRLETAKIKLDRLQDLLSRAEEMEDIITLESAISETEYQIERLSGEKRHYDALIGYSTITISLNEVYRITEVETAPLTFAQRIGIAFRDGLRDFGGAMESLAEWFAYSWLTLLVLAAIVALIVKLVVRVRTKRLTGEPVRKCGWFRKKNENASTDTPEDTK